MTIHLTHQDLAAEMGSAREVISRQLKEFERRGWLTLQRGSIELTNTRELETLARTPQM
jgi:CRP/FNR family transcriptional regulator